MGFSVKFVARFFLSGIALYIAATYFPGFHLDKTIGALVVGAFVLALLNTFLRPILKLVSTPLIWITFGLFNLFINMAILWIADILLTRLTIMDLATLFWTSLIVALANFF